jgi:hypothetical protein
MGAVPETPPEMNLLAYWGIGEFPNGRVEPFSLNRHVKPLEFTRPF